MRYYLNISWDEFIYCLVRLTEENITPSLKCLVLSDQQANIQLTEIYNKEK